MTRRKIINKDLVLDIAQNLILKKGIQGFTFEALAKKCGITKGGLQYCFGSKDQLIDTLITRWENDFAKSFSELIEKNHFSPLRSYAELTRLAISGDKARAPAMLASMLQTTKRLTRSRQWVQDRINDFSDTDNQEQHYKSSRQGSSQHVRQVHL